MKIKSILLTAAATICLATATMAQVPNYVPTNGLIGWWPFNGNANDESGNGNNGTVNGATLTSDRFGYTGKAYSFNGLSNYIDCGNSNSLNPVNLTISVWVSQNTIPTNTNFQQTILGKTAFNAGEIGYRVITDADSKNYFIWSPDGTGNDFTNTLTNLSVNNWVNIISVKSGDTLKIYKNGMFENQIIYPRSLLNNNNPLIIGAVRDIFAPSPHIVRFYDGKIDDIGIWNRALTQQEITDLYNAVNCASNTAITPQNNSLSTGSNAIFTATTSDPNPSYVWQSDFGQGYVTLNNYGSYSGVNSATLNIANVQLPNHTQPIRVISTSGNCIDTSNVALINILDTCIVTVYDTLLTTVTDTLVINAQITGINPPNNLNTLKVYPNPTSTHITIDYGHYNAMSGYTLTIVNSIGQTVFTTPINQQTSYIDLSTWSGNGIYFVQLIDPQNNTIENRKIVIQ